MKLGRAEDTGSAAIAIVTVVMALALLLALAGTVAGIVQRRSHLQGAANLAALAAATEMHYLHASDPCPIAHEVAQRNHVRVKECAVLGASVQVVVGAPGRSLGPTSAVARAGPPGQ